MDELEREEYQRLKKENAFLKERMDALHAETERIDRKMKELWAEIMEIQGKVEKPTIH